MKVVKSILLGAAALALAAGSAFAAEDKKDPGFNALDKNNDGSISRTEAKGNPDLAKKFKEADKNGDGKLSRTEYLTVMTKKDLGTLKDKVTGGDKDKTSAAGSTAKPQEKPAK